MRNAFRQRLLNYATSIVFGLAFLGLSLLIEFYANSENVFRFSDPDMAEYRAETAAFAVARSIGMFLVIFIPVFVWHISDFVLKEEPSRFWLRKLSSYRSLLAVLVLTIMGGLIIHSGVLDSLHCTEDDPNDNYFVFCTPAPERGIIPLFLVPGLVLTLLALTKLMLAIISRVRSPL